MKLGKVYHFKHKKRETKVKAFKDKKGFFHVVEEGKKGTIMLNRYAFFWKYTEV